MVAGNSFEAGKYLTDLRGKDYLEVKWRLLWLRTEHPDAHIATELVKQDDGFALFRAEASIPGGGSATGWGSQTASEFGDYIEKAETKALGRALAALGFGTQFCEDFDFSARSGKDARRTVGHPSSPAQGQIEGESDQRVVDAPVTRARLRAVDGQAETPATASQVKAIYAIGRDLPRVADGDIDARCRARFGCVPSALTKRQASEFIDALRKQPAAGSTSQTG